MSPKSVVRDTGPLQLPGPPDPGTQGSKASETRVSDLSRAREADRVRTPAGDCRPGKAEDQEGHCRGQFLGGPIKNRPWMCRSKCGTKSRKTNSGGTSTHMSHCLHCHRCHRHRSRPHSVAIVALSSIRHQSSPSSPSSSSSSSIYS